MNGPYTSLEDWDALVYLTKGRMRESDSTWSLSFNTCVLKEAARMMLEAEGLSVGTFTTMGRKFTITAAFNNDHEANDYMESHPREGVIHAFKDGLVIIASVDDKGGPV